MSQKLDNYTHKLSVKDMIVDGGRKFHLCANVAMIVTSEPNIAKDTDADYAEEKLLSADPFNIDCIVSVQVKQHVSTL